MSSSARASELEGIKESVRERLKDGGRPIVNLFDPSENLFIRIAPQDVGQISSGVAAGEQDCPIPLRLIRRPDWSCNRCSANGGKISEPPDVLFFYDKENIFRYCDVSDVGVVSVAAIPTLTAHLVVSKDENHRQITEVKWATGAETVKDSQSAFTFQPVHCPTLNQCYYPHSEVRTHKDGVAIKKQLDNVVGKDFIRIISRSLKMALSKDRSLSED